MTTDVTTPWRNRITGYGEEAPDQLLANPLNFRVHPAYQQDVLSGVLNDVGVVQNILVNTTTGRMIDGHLRVSLALRNGQPTVPVTYVALTEAEERLILATLDPMSVLAGTDKANLDALLHDLDTGNPAIIQMLDELSFDVVFQDGPSSAPATGRIGQARTQTLVKAVFAVDQLATIESAIASVGIANRGEALTMICLAYLDEKR